MEFEGAIHAVKDMKKVKRKSWDGYLFMTRSPSKLADNTGTEFYDLDDFIMIKIESDNDYDIEEFHHDEEVTPYEEYVPSPHDMIADDWEIVGKN